MYFGDKSLTCFKSISHDIISRLQVAHINTCSDFLSHSSLEIMEILSFSYSQFLTLRDQIDIFIAPNPQNVLSLYLSPKKHLSTRLHRLDSALAGGIPAASITEISAPPGCGKTQICIMLSALCSMSVDCGGQGLKVIYIDTEGAFSAHRLIEIAKSHDPAYYSSIKRINDLANQVLVYKDLTCQSLNKRLQSLDELIASYNIGLVIVDSIASLIRKEYDVRTTRGAADRSSMLAWQASLLKFVAEEYNIPVVVTNQITVKLAPSVVKRSNWSNDYQSLVVASLGNTWSHCVTTRLVMEFWEDKRRKLSIAKSPLSANDSMIIKLEEKGLVMDWTATGELSSGIEGDPTFHSLTVQSDIL